MYIGLYLLMADTTKKLLIKISQITKHYRIPHPPESVLI